MSQSEYMARHQRHGLAVVEADAGNGAGGIKRSLDDGWQACSLQQCAQLGPMACPHQDQPVHPARNQPLGLNERPICVVAAGGDDETVAASLQSLLDGLDAGGED